MEIVAEEKTSKEVFFCQVGLFASHSQRTESLFSASRKGQHKAGPKKMSTENGTIIFFVLFVFSYSGSKGKLLDWQHLFIQMKEPK